MARFLLSRGHDASDEDDSTAGAQEAAQEILQALFVTDPQKDLIRARNRRRAGRIEGSCEWITESPEYIAWRNEGTPQLLMVVGEPGIGKTAMATFLIERITTAAEVDHSTLAYFFCNHAEPNRRTAVSILKGLLHQILTRKPQLFDHAYRLWEVHGTAGFDEFESLWFLFVRVVQDPRVGQLTLLLDSLDNCEMPMRRTLVRRLGELLRSGLGVKTHHWRLCVLTRPHAWDLGFCVSGRRKLDWMSVITMSPASVGSDLNKLISEEVDTVGDSRGWSYDTRKAVQAQLVAKNGGTFLWISLVLRCVAETNEDLIVRKLKRFTGTLKDLYARILRRIEPEDTEICECILHYVLGASRPLTLAELAIALFYRESQNCERQLMPSDAQIDELKASIKCCALLLRFNGRGHHATIEFVHQSVADFLVGPDVPHRLRRYNTTYAKASERLARACAAYLATPELCKVSSDVRRMVRLAKSRADLPSKSRDSVIYRKDSQSDSAFSPRSSDMASTAGYVPITNKQITFLQYATATWSTAGAWKQMRVLPSYVLPLLKLHSREAELLFETAKIAIAEGSDLIFRHLVKLLLRRLSLDDGLHLFQAAIQYDETGIEPAPGTKERVFWTEELPDAEAIYHELKSRWSNLLHGAAEVGLLDVVKYCIQHDDDVVIRDTDNQTALHFAAREGHLKVVKLLVKADTARSTLIAADRLGQVPLHIAVSAGEYDIARVLLKADFGKSTLRAQDRDGETPLHRAVYTEDAAMTKLLLNADLDNAAILTKDRDGRLPLHAAALAGGIKVVALLLEADLIGRTLNSKDREGKTPLDHAIEQAEAQEGRGHAQVAEYLRSQSMLMLFGEPSQTWGHADSSLAVRSLSM